MSNGVELPSPPSVLSEIWRRLTRAVGHANDPLRTPVLGACDTSGSHVRIVVLRGVEEADAALLAYTDARSAKVRQIIDHPRVSWLFWDAADRLQVRMAGEAAVHAADALADTAWASLSEEGRRLYAGPPPGGPHDAAPTGPPRDNFAVIRCTVDCIDWLDLSVPGHRRLQFFRQQDEWTGRWVAP